MLGGGRGVPARILGLILLLFAGPPAAHAGSGGINLSWNDCSSFGGAQKSFACDASGVRVSLVASAIVGTAMPELNGQTAVLEVQTSGGDLPPWWQLTSPGCRYGVPSQISADFNFSDGGSCQDPWQGRAAGGLNYKPGAGGSNRAQIRTICAIPAPTPITGSDEYSFFRISISTAKSSACSGCGDGVCIVFDSILLTQPPGVGDYTITTPLFRNYVLWQGGATSAGSGGCSGASVQTVKTWGGVKSLYR